MQHLFDPYCDADDVDPYDPDFDLIGAMSVYIEDGVSPNTDPADAVRCLVSMDP